MSSTTFRHLHRFLLPLGVCVLAAIVVSGGCRPAENGGSTSNGHSGVANRPPLFQEVDQELGLRFVHDAGRPGTWFFPEIMVMGAAMFDCDGDGDLDIYLINSGAPPIPGVARDETRARNRLFRQEQNGHFVDFTDESGLGDEGYGIGVAVGDVTNDGLPDVYLTNYGQDRLFLNEGQGHFRDVTERCGVTNERWSAAACFVDYDRDGWLDLYVSNYVDYFPSRACHGPSGRRDYCGPVAFDKTVDKLFRNVSGALAKSDTDGTAGAARVRFEDVSVRSGIAAHRGSGLGVMALDFNDDGWQDIYVANDMVGNFLWINQQDGTFRDEALLRGVAYDAQGRPQASMGLAVTDLNEDEVPDLYVTHMAGEMNVLYVSDGVDGYRESAMQHGLCAPLHPWTSFGAAFLDIDHDGSDDAVVVNGSMKLPDTAVAVPDHPDPKKYWPIFSEPNHILLNDGQEVFSVYRSGQEEFSQVREVSRALCAGDIDGDGDLDLLVANTAAPARLYRNVAAKKGNWLRVRAVEPEHGGRDALGARVVVVGPSRRWTRWISPASSYLSSHDPIAHFGLGKLDRIRGIRVRWPDGADEVFAGGKPNRLLVLSHGEGAAP